MFHDLFSSVDTQMLAAILLAAGVTYSLRVGGLLLAARMPKQGRFRRGMEALPGALLLSLVIPSVAEAGVWGVVAAACTALIVLKTRSTLLAMLVGMGVIFLQRQAGL